MSGRSARRRVARGVLGAVVLAATAHLGARGFGSVPPLGPLLDPAHGAWARARPDATGSVAAIPGLSGPVDVRFDRRGVPHIFARSEEDAYRALGYVVARDRLFQLYVQTLAATGRLTEIGGRDLLATDREMRRLGLPRAAERKWAALQGTRSARIIRAYAEGIGAYVRTIPPARYPLELRLLGIRTVEWQPVNSIHLLGRMGWTLAYLAPELTRAAAAAAVGRAAAAALFPEHSPIQQPIQPAGGPAPRFDFEPLPPPGAPDTGAVRVAAAAGAFFTARDPLGPIAERPAQASNNWVVAPARTAAGAPLLAGDPHLELSLPSIWYETHLVVPGRLDVYGVTIPGEPAVIIGFNRDAAWSFTNTGADVLDFYQETVDDSLRPMRYLVDGAWRPLERRIERYRGRDGAVVATDTLYFTHRGPMQRAERGGWVSMRWTVLEPSDEMAALVGLSRARSAAAVEETMSRYFWAPAQNVAAADRAGHIAIRSVGRFPIRPDTLGGLVVRDGSRSASDWTGFAPPSRYPQAFDPQQGFLASANQDPLAPAASSLYLGVIGFDPWRAMRINRLLRANDRATPDDMRRMQLDAISERARTFLPYFLGAARSVLGQRTGASGLDTAALASAARILAGWDTSYARDDRRAVLFEAAMRQLVSRTWDELAAARGGARAPVPSGAVLAELCADSASVWWDDRRTPGREHRDDILAASLAAALADTRARRGSDLGEAWRWDRVQRTNIHHLLHIPSLSALGLPPPGGPHTISPSAGDGIFGSSWRMVVELGPEVRAWGTYPGGQSGDPANPQYRDRIPGWVAGTLDTLYFPRSAAAMDAAHTAARLVLTRAARSERE